MEAKVELELKEVLARIETRFDKIDLKLDKVSDDIGEIKIDQAKIVGHLERHDSEIATIREDIKELKGSQRAQIWTLIGILIAAVAGFLAAVAKLVFNF